MDTTTTANGRFIRTCANGIVVYTDSVSVFLMCACLSHVDCTFCEFSLHCMWVHASNFLITSALIVSPNIQFVGVCGYAAQVRDRDEAVALC